MFGSVDITEDVLACTGHPRSVTCVALEEGAVLVQISQELFLEFVADRPRTLLMYLQTVRLLVSDPVRLPSGCLRLYGC